MYSSGDSDDEEAMVFRRGHGADHKIPGYIFKREKYEGVIERTLLFPRIHPVTGQFDFITERDVRNWGYDTGEPQGRRHPLASDKA
eukprot:432282-Pyramimonas_sp.AAC.1